MIACAQPTDGVYCEPTSPDIGRTIGRFRAREIADDSDVSTVAESSGFSERARECILERQSEREQKRARAIVRAGRIVLSVEQRAENYLREIVAARGELVDDFLLGHEARLLGVVETARCENEICNALPVEAGFGAARVRYAMVEASVPVMR